MADDTVIRVIPFPAGGKSGMSPEVEAAVALIYDRLTQAVLDEFPIYTPEGEPPPVDYLVNVGLVAWRRASVEIVQDPTYSEYVRRVIAHALRTKAGELTTTLEIQAKQLLGVE